jgi:hypothetical protein
VSKHDNKEWLTGSKEGLRQLVEDRGKAFLIGELIQNAWDEDGVTEVNIWIEGIAGKSKARISVEDNSPRGFENVEDMFTLFNPSKKKKDPTKRGRFNLGEKICLAVCDWAEIISVNCAMIFDSKGRRASKKRREKGTVFTAIVPLTRAEQKEIELYVETLIPPPGMKTTFNGDDLQEREPMKVFNEALPTVFENAEGQFRNTTRKTDIQVFEPGPDETPHIYEMGIPVVETDIKWHVNVLQKVPLNMDRDNVPPSFQRKICTAVMNRMVHELEDEDTSSVWVHEATENPDIEDEVVEQYMDKRFGKKRVQFDPSDLEANKIAVSKGYTVVHGNSLSPKQRANVKRANALLPAGQVTPSPVATFSTTGKDVTVPQSKWSDGMEHIVEWTKTLGRELLGAEVFVDVVNDPRNYSACYSRDDGLLFNVRRLGKKWFQRGPKAEVLQLIIHEFGHHYAADHLSKEYHDALCKLGVKVGRLAYTKPELFGGVFIED